ncbi:hypothetical protein HDU89_000757 [Geranomyces variabilis]|nr:hypothetical protein HDU89_000757 [Geranomyces variabilis]
MPTSSSTDQPDGINAATASILKSAVRKSSVSTHPQPTSNGHDNNDINNNGDVAAGTFSKDCSCKPAALTGIADRLRDTSTLVCNSQGRAAWWSEKASKLLGWDGEYWAAPKSTARPNMGDRNAELSELKFLHLRKDPQCVQKVRRDGQVVTVLQSVTEIHLDAAVHELLDPVAYVISMVDISSAANSLSNQLDAVNFVAPSSASTSPFEVDGLAQPQQQQQLTVENLAMGGPVQMSDSGKITSVPADPTETVAHSVIQALPVPFPLKAIAALVPEPSADAHASAEAVLNTVYRSTYGQEGNPFLKDIVKRLCLELDARLCFIGFYVAKPHITTTTVDLISALTAPEGYPSLVSGLRKTNRERVAADDGKINIAGFEIKAFVGNNGLHSMGPDTQVYPEFIALLQKQEASVIDASKPPMLPNLQSFADEGELCCVMGLHKDSHVIGGIGLVFSAAALTDRVHQLQLVLQRVAPRVTIEVSRMAELERLTREKLAAEVATKSKSHFLANMSHELRTPVSAIVGLTDMILWDDIELSEENRARLELINSSGEHLLSVINGVLDLSKIGDEDVHFQLKESPIRLRKIIKQAVHLSALSPAASKKEIKILEAPAPKDSTPSGALAFAWKVDASVPDHVVGDATRIRQVILNLLTNALKYTSRGSVKLNVSQVEKEEDLNHTQFESQHHPLSRSRSSLSSAMDMPTPPESRRPSSKNVSDYSGSECGDPPKPRVVLLFTITDTGCGIPADKLDQLFKPYSQLDNPNNRDTAVGTGLGLAISARLVEAMNGHIWVDSSAGGGSKFSVCLPFLIPEDGDDRSSSPASEPEPSLTARPKITRNRSSTDNQSAKSGHTPEPPVEDSINTLEPVLVKVIQSAATEIAKDGPSGHSKETQAHAPAGKTSKRHGKRLTVSNISAQYPLKILVAEDNPINQQIALGLLRKMGYEDAELADDGLKVLEKVEKVHYDLILMDLAMPNMGGIEAAKALGERWNNANPHDAQRRPPIVIALTASGTAEDFERCREAGMHDWLNKPFRSNELQEKISQHFAHLRKEETSVA